jgi:hypothetical protein
VDIVDAGYSDALLTGWIYFLLTKHSHFKGIELDYADIVNTPYV